MDNQERLNLKPLRENLEVAKIEKYLFEMITLAISLKNTKTLKIKKQIKVERQDLITTLDLNKLQLHLHHGKVQLGVGNFWITSATLEIRTTYNQEGLLAT